MYDIIFLSYGEPNANENWQKLKEQFPNAKRVDGVTGIHAAHRAAAKKALTKMFWVVDADAKIVSDFKFKIHPAFREIQEDTVYVWRSQNPVNGLIYGYGGVKLLPKKLVKNIADDTCDVTTSVSKNFMPMPELSNLTAFNTDSFNAWKSGFRECAKLASNVIDRQKDQESLKRLNTWCNVGTTMPYGIDAIRGANEGRKFGEDNKNNLNKLLKLNDFEWLKEQYDKLAR